MMPETTSMPEGIDGLHAFEDADHHVLVLVHRLQRFGVGRLDTDEDGDEAASRIFSRIRRWRY